MDYRILGASGVRVSTLCLGSAFFGIRPAGRKVDRLVGRALDAGINFIDTANSYGNQARFDRPGVPGWQERESSEELVGRAIRGRRESLVIATKVQERVGDGPNDGGPAGGGLTRRHVMEQCDQSLRRLGTDRIDVYYAHHVDPTTPIEQTLRAFDDLVTAGKVRYVGLSNFAGWELARAHGICERRGWVAPVAMEMPYSLANRWIEREVVPACLAHDVGITCYSPLEAGLLTGEVTAERPAGNPSRVRRGGQAFTQAQVDFAARLDALAGEWGSTPATLALAWLVARPGVASVILGPETGDDLEAGLAAISHVLDDAQRQALDDLVLA